MSKSKCFILCNVNNEQSLYLFASNAGSNFSNYIANSLPKDFDVYLLNVGAPIKKWQFKEKNHQFKVNSSTIVEFAGGLSILPTRIKAKLIINRAIKFAIKNKKENDKIIIYHSLSFMKYYKLLIESFSIDNALLFVAELYSDVGNIKFSVSKEINYIQNFKKTIMISRPLYKKIVNESIANQTIFLYGAYNPIKDIFYKGSDDLIHVVYAGTASKIKGGLFSVLSASKYLPRNYLVHIYTRGDESLINYIKSFPVRYEGYVNERKLLEIIKQYDIGLATQNPHLAFNESSFPSKIVSYLACGLNVVSSKSISVTVSPFKDVVTFYDEDESGQNLAQAIMKSAININREKNIQFICQLDNEFRAKLQLLLEGKLQ